MKKAIREITPVSVDTLGNYTRLDEKVVDDLLAEQLFKLDKKIVVLDDDPTGVQTVHNVSVYTDWTPQTMQAAFEEPGSMFFILTNSRGMLRGESEKCHVEIARNIVSASKATGKDYIIISRSDSTLRGHYPLETLTVKTEIEALTGNRFDGEIIYPFFKEGGRYTFGDVHYVKEGEQLTPVGQTEFARDKSFGYLASDLTKWCEEKSGGAYPTEDVTSISLEDLRSLNIQKITDQLMAVKDFNKIVVNSIDYVDVKVFAIAFCKALAQNKRYIFRSAAAITKVLGGVPDKELLTRDDLVAPGNDNGGIVLIGSHVHKTTQQLEELKNCKFPICFIEFNQHLVLREGGLEGEVDRVIDMVEEKIKAGQTVAVYTRRDRFDLDTDDKDLQLTVSVKISNAVTSIIGNLSVKPSFIIAKGGITSSDVGTKALKVKRATVMGQVRPGVPVWQTNAESKFPNMPYIIFPGNVGSVDDLKVVVETLMEKAAKENPA